MQPETARWLNESRGSFSAAHGRFNDISSMDLTGAGALFMSAEYALKAVIIDARSRRDEVSISRTPLTGGGRGEEDLL